MESMTGYSEGSFSNSSFDMKISARCLNNRYLDIVIKGGFFLRPLEEDIRKIARNYFKRGRLEIVIEIRFVSPEKQKVYINREAISAVLRELRTFSGFAPLSLDAILRIPGVIELSFNEDGFTDKEKEFIFSSLTKVLEALKRNRMKEGERIRKYIKERVKKIAKKKVEIEKIFSGEKDRIREEIERKIREMSVDVDENRIVQEAAVLSLRYDISEEVSRIGFHLEEFRKSMGDGSKKMDFVAQEILREANTLNSKTTNPEIIKRAIVIKTTVEEIREQIHNLE